MRKIRLKLISNIIITVVCILFLCILVFAYYNKHHPSYQKNSIYNRSAYNFSELFYLEKDKTLNQDTPRNLFITFSYALFNIWCGKFEETPAAINCISAKPSKNLTDTEKKQLRTDCINLAFLIFDTPFYIKDIPVNVPGNSCTVRLGHRKRIRYFYLSKRKSGTWYFTKENFTDTEQIDSVKRYNYEYRFFDEKDSYHLTPLSCYVYFMSGALNLANLNTSSSREMLDLSWVDPIIRNQYGDFLVFHLRKTMQVEKVSIFSIPINPPKNELIITLCTCNKTGLSIYLQKKYLDNTKDMATWIFNRSVQMNALENCIATRVVLESPSPEDPLWFHMQHIITTLSNNCLISINFYLLITILASIIIVYVIYKILKKILFLILNKFNPAPVAGHYRRYSNRLAKSASLLISLYFFVQFTYHYFIFYYNIFIYFTYFSIIAYWIISIWVICELINLISVIISMSLEKRIKKGFRVSFFVELFRQLLFLLTIIFSIGILLQELGINMLNFLTALGIGGFALAYAAKGAIENLLGSIIIAWERPFKIGDWIIVGNTEGTVEHIGLRSTRIRTFQDSYCTIPNIQLTTTNVDNMDERNNRRYYTTLEVDGSSSPELLHSFTEGIRKIIENTPSMKQNEYHIRVNDFGNFSIKIMVYVFFTATDWNTELEEREKFILNILKLAKKLNIKTSYNQKQAIYLTKHKPKDSKGKQKNIGLKTLIKNILKSNVNNNISK